MNDRPLPRILARIRATKEEEIKTLLATASPVEWIARARATLAADPPRDFFAAVARPTSPLNLIAEIKKASPSKGLIRPDFAPPALARAYEEGGASAISCLTDTVYFQGADEYLAAAREATALPVLRKDFLIDPVQIAQARTLGADAVLLIARMLSADMLERLLDLTRELAMTALVEVHDPDDIDKAIAAEAPLVGINNRDLDTFTVDVQTVARLRPMLPSDCHVVAESGIFTHEDCLAMANGGACAVLVGESLMRQDNLVRATQSLLGTA